MADVHSETVNPDVHHETSDANVRAIFGFALGLIIAAVFIHFGVWLLFIFLAANEKPHTAPEYPLAAGQQQRQPPEPRLQTNPRADLRDLRTQEDAILNSYGWADKNGGIVRIPIADAMKLAVERGLPARADTKASK